MPSKPLDQIRDIIATRLKFTIVKYTEMKELIEMLLSYGLIGMFDTITMMVGESCAIAETVKVPQRNPNNRAVYSGISFFEIQQYSLQLAAQLYHRYGLRSGDRVLILCSSHVGAEVVACLACLRIGVLFVPIDDEWMSNNIRMTSIVHDSIPSAAIVVGKSDRSPLVQKLGIFGIHRCALINEDGSAVMDESSCCDIRDDLPMSYIPPATTLNQVFSGNPENESVQDDIYLLYTSGSTGAPKAVIGSHKSLLNRIAWQWNRFPFQKKEIEERESIESNDSNFGDEENSENETNNMTSSITDRSPIDEEERGGNNAIKSSERDEVDEVESAEDSEDEVNDEDELSCSMYDELMVRRTPLIFVDSMAEIFGSLLAGVPLYSPPRSKLESGGLAAVVKDCANMFASRITMLPSQLHQVLRLIPDRLEVLWPSLQLVVVSGEPCPHIVKTEFSRNCDSKYLVNLYGSTEVTGDVTFAVLQKPAIESGKSTYFANVCGDFSDMLTKSMENRSCDNIYDIQKAELIPIGVPMDNNFVLLVRDYGEGSSYDDVVSGTDEIGEIVVIGFHVTRGYFNNESVTNAKFKPISQGIKAYITKNISSLFDHPNSFTSDLNYQAISMSIKEACGDAFSISSNSSLPCAVMYCTGDLATKHEYQHSNGLVESYFVHRGRKDRQVKVRGIRVELEEIEQLVRSLIKYEVVVFAINAKEIFDTSDADNMQLVMVIESSAMTALGYKSTFELKQKIDQCLISAHIPHTILSYDKPFSRNVTGKLNRTAILEDIRVQLQSESKLPKVSLKSESIQNSIISMLKDMIPSFRANILSCTDTENVSLSQLGVDSIALVELNWRLKNYLNESLSYVAPDSGILSLEDIHEYNISDICSKIQAKVDNLENPSSLERKKRSVVELRNSTNSKEEKKARVVSFLNQSSYKISSYCSKLSPVYSRVPAYHTMKHHRPSNLSVVIKHPFSRCVDSTALIVSFQNNINLNEVKHIAYMCDHNGLLYAFESEYSNLQGIGPVLSNVVEHCHIESAISMCINAKLMFVSGYFATDKDDIPHVAETSEYSTTDPIFLNFYMELDGTEIRNTMLHTRTDAEIPLYSSKFGVLHDVRAVDREVIEKSTNTLNTENEQHIFGGVVVALNPFNASIQWKTYFPSEIKGSVAILQEAVRIFEPNTDLSNIPNLGIVGCYNHYAYIIDLNVGCVINKIPTGGAVFATPTIAVTHVNKDQVDFRCIIATLKGVILSYSFSTRHADCNCIAIPKISLSFSIDTESPIFSSIVNVFPSAILSSSEALGGFLISTSVSGSICVFESDDGSLANSITVARPIFHGANFINAIEVSKQVLTSENFMTIKLYSLLETKPGDLSIELAKSLSIILYGSNCGEIHLSNISGNSLTTLNINSPVYSTPFVCNNWRIEVDNDERISVVTDVIACCVSGDVNHAYLRCNYLKIQNDQMTSFDLNPELVESIVTFDLELVKTIRLDGEIYSSPVVCISDSQDINIFIGCRDDCFYHLQL